MAREDFCRMAMGLAGNGDDDDEPNAMPAELVFS